MNAQQILNQLRALLASDGYAASFQSLGAYRTALLRLIDASKNAGNEQQEAP